MNKRTRQYFQGILICIGLVLIVIGIASGKPGAWIIGLIVAAVNLWRWPRGNRQESTNDKATPQG